MLISSVSGWQLSESRLQLLLVKSENFRTSKYPGIVMASCLVPMCLLSLGASRWDIKASQLGILLRTLDELISVEHLRFWVFVGIGSGIVLSMDVLINTWVKIRGSVLQILCLGAYLVISTAIVSHYHHAFDPKAPFMDTNLLTCISIVHITFRLLMLLAPGNFSLAEGFCLVQGTVLLFADAYARHLSLSHSGTPITKWSDIDLATAWRVYLLLQAMIIGMLLIGLLNYPLLRLVRFYRFQSAWTYRSLSVLFYASMAYWVLQAREWFMFMATGDQTMQDPFLWTIEFTMQSNNLVIVAWWVACLGLMVIGLQVLGLHPGSNYNPKDTLTSWIQFEVRRKYFHLIGVFMFIPGICLGPMLSSLAFGVAIAAFMLIEYVRIFTVWIPFMDVSLLTTFLIRFTEQDKSVTSDVTQEADKLNISRGLLDDLPATLTLADVKTLRHRPKPPRKHKNSLPQRSALVESIEKPMKRSNSIIELTRTWDLGPLILSHIYLIVGCALPLWLTRPSALQVHKGLSEQQMIMIVMSWLSASSGIVATGIADALAAVFGKRFGRHRWVSGQSHFRKTVEGTLGCLLGCFLGWAVILLLLCVSDSSFVEFILQSRHFESITRAIIMCSFGASMLEAVSCQNDNLLLPLFCTTFFHLM